MTWLTSVRVGSMTGVSVLTTEARAQVLAHRRAIEETRLQRERDAERRAREQRQAQAERERAEFSRRWLRWANNSLPDWLTPEQRQVVVGAVKTELAECDPGEPDSQVVPILEKAIERTIAPWRAEREERIWREKLIEQAMWRLPWGATDGDKARATASARAALSSLPLDANSRKSASTCRAKSSVAGAAIFAFISATTLAPCLSPSRNLGVVPMFMIVESLSLKRWLYHPVETNAATAKVSALCPVARPHFPHLFFVSPPEAVYSWTNSSLSLI